MGKSGISNFEREKSYRQNDVKIDGKVAVAYEIGDMTFHFSLFSVFVIRSSVLVCMHVFVIPRLFHGSGEQKGFTCIQKHMCFIDFNRFFAVISQ